MSKDRISKELSRYSEAAQKDAANGSPKYASGHRDVLDDIFLNSNADKQKFIDTYNKSYEAAKANYTPPSRTSQSSHYNEVCTTESYSDDYDYDDSNVSSGYTPPSSPSVTTATTSRPVDSSSKGCSVGHLPDTPLFIKILMFAAVLFIDFSCISEFSQSNNEKKEAVLIESKEPTEQSSSTQEESLETTTKKQVGER